MPAHGDAHGVHRGGATVARGRREPCEDEEDDQAAPFSQQWRRDVDGGEGGVSSFAPAGLGLRQLLGTLLVPQLRWGVRRRLLHHLQLLPLLLLLYLSRISPLNLYCLSLAL